MIFEFENKNLFEDNHIFKKNKGENILFIGDTGSGVKDSALNLFKFMLEKKYINNHSIFLDFYGDKLFYFKWISILNDHFSKNITKQNFQLFNLLDDKEMDLFPSLKFNHKIIQNYLKKHVMLLSPVFLYKNKEKNIETRYLEYLHNLPINEEKEVPIFISGTSFFNLKHQNLINKLNKIGYFFIVISDSYKIQFDNIKKLENIFQHTFIFTSFANLGSALNFNFFELEKFNYYYFYKFQSISDNVFNYPTKELNVLNNLPEYEKISTLISEVIFSDKLKNF